MAFPNTSSPVNVLLFARSVEEAAKMVMSVEPSKATPLMFFVAASLVAVPALPPIDTVVVDVHVGMPFRYARMFPPVPAVVVASAPVPLPYRMPPAWMLAQPVPPFPTASCVPDQLPLLTVLRVASEPRPGT